MDTQEFIDAALAEVGESFATDARSNKILQIILDKYPNTTPQETWIALPILFWRGVLSVMVLRSTPYGDFLRTPYWLAVSEHIKGLHPWCVLCTEPLSSPLEVHHRTYIHRGDEWLHVGDLCVLCHECHDWISRKPSRWKIIPRKG